MANDESQPNVPKHMSLIDSVKAEEELALQNLNKPFAEIERAKKYIVKTNEGYISTLKELSKAKEQLDLDKKIFRTLSHDLRDPLGAITQLTDMLGEQYDALVAKFPDIAKSKEFKEFSTIFEYMCASAHAGQNTFLKYTDWTKKALNGEKSNSDNYFLNDLLSETYQDAKVLITDPKKVNLVFREDTIPSLVYTDKNIVSIILNNLISNSTKFTPAGKSIYLSSETFSENNNYVKITVSDEGKGIAPEIADKLFLTEVTTDGINGEKGTGTGLRRCQEQVTELGGKIWVESKPNQIGTTISFTLPKYHPTKMYIAGSI